MAAYLPRPRAVAVKLTVAQVNAGIDIVPGDPERAIRVVDATARAIGGNVGTATGVDVTNTAGTTKVASFARAGLTDGALVRAGAANTTLGAGWNADLAAGQGLKIVKDGGDLDTATHIEVTVLYVRTRAS